ncbi:glycoside hydrolase family 25 protein [Longimicrobium sp.]|uniref:glycoside hydrolase family 25 protein n=1 Tax=Longimicrobium sp. TaxID=2029185 RepID=UPI002B5B0709|nr:glycoside hydrolase family 25 protein [Longimicrobium sp.]HSU12920.1 glycoside hydrolase family 25 protein [Longimicrobium sp.]
MLDVVIDLHGPEPVKSWEMVKNAGIMAVIHKATEGMDFTDKKFAQRRVEAQKAGLLWGSYHFGTASDPGKQARNFLEVVDPGPKDLIVLDLEENFKNPPNSMSVHKAEVFVTFVHDRLGRWPVLYAGADLRSLLNGKPNEILRNCELWLADWRDEPHLLPGWDRFALWQYSGGTSKTTGSHTKVPHPVPGLVEPPDRSKFNGDEQEMRKFFGAG